MVQAQGIAMLERAVSNKLAVFGQQAQAVSEKLQGIKVTAMNQQFPVFDDMTGYNPNSSSGIGGDNTQVLKPNAEYKPAAIFYTNKVIDIPFGTKRALSALDDPEGKQFINLIAKGIADSKFVTLEYNIHKAITSQVYSNDSNIFSAGNINADSAGSAFREAVNNAISYLKNSLNGMSISRKVIIAIPEKSWYRLTASQRLVNYFNGYAQQNANFNMQTISAIFSENAGINIEVVVGGMRYLDSKFATGTSELIWGDDNAFYIFASTSDMYGDRASIKRLEGIEKLSIYQKGNTTSIDFYTDYGYFVDIDKAFTRVEFTTA